MVMLKVEGMMCKHCEMRITQGLTEAKIDGTVDLANKLVTLSNDQQVTAARVVLEDLGYSSAVI
jgi:copper chaperone CopZ